MTAFPLLGSECSMAENRYLLNAQLAQMLKGGVIMDVINVEQAQIAQEAGAVAVMALERVPADIRKQGGVARMSDPGLIRAIKEAVTIPVMAKARIGHFVEAQILQALKIDYIDESEEDVYKRQDSDHAADRLDGVVAASRGSSRLDRTDPADLPPDLRVL